MYDKKLTCDKLLEANNRGQRNKSNKRELLKYNIMLENNIINIYKKLKNSTYMLSKYHTFKIYEPKERVIKSLPYNDRIVQQWYIEEFIKPYILPRLINDTYACLEGRGTHKAIQKLQHYMRIINRNNKDYYILKCDIHKFFYSIDKDILYNIMTRYIKDKKLLNLTKIFIYDDDNNKSIPIGNYTSQYFANIYLNELDHYVNNTLKVNYYIRFMDDFILLLNNKGECKKIKDDIELYLANKLHLNLNPKSNYYPNRMGVDFCGYILFNTHILIRKRSKYKMKKEIKRWTKLKFSNNLDISSLYTSYNSWLAHVKHSNSYNLVNKMRDEINKILI